MEVGPGGKQIQLEDPTGSNPVGAANNPFLSASCSKIVKRDELERFKIPDAGE
jgi:hypothetical protein